MNRPFRCCLPFRERNNVNTSEFCFLLRISWKSVQFKIDTGADISVISISSYQALPQRPTLKPLNALLSSPVGMPNCKGQFTAAISLKNNLYYFEIYFIQGSCVNNLLILILAVCRTRVTTNSVDMTSLATSLPVAQWLERPTGVREVMGSIPVGDSDFFFFPRS